MKRESQPRVVTMMRLPQRLAWALAGRAVATGRTKTSLVVEALERLLDINKEKPQENDTYANE